MEDYKIRFLAPCEASILYDEDLNNYDFKLYMIINTLSRRYGYCFAKNKQLAEFTNATERYVQDSIQRLKEKKYIYVQNKDGNKRIIKTYIDICVDNKEEISQRKELFDYDWLNED